MSLRGPDAGTPRRNRFSGSVKVLGGGGGGGGHTRAPAIIKDPTRIEINHACRAAQYDYRHVYIHIRTEIGRLDPLGIARDTKRVYL